ncbi:hypothetical protein HSRCO_0698 [Halanaeroarchaeum sp. HSR-CO]|nr:hypothetical protein HSRCO_0698 [Halanaeroarchaeum sp. HSR-CO]
MQSAFRTRSTGTARTGCSSRSAVHRSATFHDDPVPTVPSTTRPVHERVAENLSTIGVPHAQA